MKITRTNKNELQNLEQQIAAGRRRLQMLWDDRGYTDAAVLNASIELDRLLNRYQKQKTEASPPS